MGQEIQGNSNLCHRLLERPWFWQNQEACILKAFKNKVKIL